MTCTPGVTQAGCEAGGGTWDAEASKCAPAYNCFVAGFCAHAAKIYPPATSDYTNVYDGHKQATDPECKSDTSATFGADAWRRGIVVFEELHHVAATEVEGALGVTSAWMQASYICKGN